MKALQIRIYGAAMLGVFLACYHFVGAQYMNLYPITAEGPSTVPQRGLRVGIQLNTQNERQYELFPVKSYSKIQYKLFPDKSYLFVFLICEEDINAAFSRFHETPRSPMIIEGASHMAILCDLHKECPVPTLSTMKAMSRNPSNTLEQQYVAGWVVEESLVKQMTKNVADLRTLTTMDPLVYITFNRGIYSFVMEKVPRLYLYDVHSADNDFIKETHLLSAAIKFHGSTESRHVVEFRPGDEMTLIPKIVWDTLAPYFYGFKKEMGRYKRSCPDEAAYNKIVLHTQSTQESALPPLNVLVDTFELLFKAQEYVVFTKENGKGKCVMDIAPSPNDILVLGSSFLKAYSITVNTLGEQRLYRFSK